jgi:hypothetical protein
LTRKRLEALESLEPRLLFSAKGSPMYLTDLLAIIRNEEVLPFLKDRRKDVVAALSVVNRFRQDAHGNEISEDELVECRRAFEILEGEFC